MSRSDHTKVQTMNTTSSTICILENVRNLLIRISWCLISRRCLRTWHCHQHVKVKNMVTLSIDQDAIRLLVVSLQQEDGMFESCNGSGMYTIYTCVLSFSTLGYQLCANWLGYEYIIFTMNCSILFEHIFKHMFFWLSLSPSFFLYLSIYLSRLQNI